MNNLKLISLKLQNFKVFKNLKLDFFDGILAIIGQNESGKSTIINSILFALFGNKSTPSIQNLVNFNSTKASMILDFQIKDKIYRVLRELRKSKKGNVSQSKAEFFEVLSEKETLSLAIKPSEVDPLIQKTIGFSYKELTHSNIISQKKLDKLSKLPPQQWKTLFNEFLNLEGFGEAVIELKDEKSLQSTNLTNSKLQLENLNRQKDDYWDEFKELMVNSRTHLRKAMKVRTLNGEIKKNDQLKSIAEDYKDKKEQKENLEDKKASEQEILDNKLAQLKNIEDLEQKNKELVEELQDYEGIDDDSLRISKIKIAFDNFKETKENVEEKELKLEYIIELEDQFAEKSLEFEDYYDTPEQKELYREINSNYNSLKLFHEVKRNLENELKKISKLQDRNQILLSELEIIEENLSYEPKYKELESSCEIFKAKIEQIKFERSEQRKLTHEIKLTRKQCPKDTPDSIAEIRTFQSPFSQQDTLINLLMNKPILILLLILLTSLAIIPLFFGFFIFSLIILFGLVCLFVYSLIKVKITLKICKNLEILIYSIQTLEEIENRVKGTVEDLNTIFVEIQTEISSFPPYYSKLFESKDSLDERELILRVYFETLNRKLIQLSIKKEEMVQEVNENNLIIEQKPILEKDEVKNNYNIKNTQENLELYFSDFKMKYCLDVIKTAYLEPSPNFIEIKSVLNDIKTEINKDLDEFESLNNTINDLKKKIEIKPQLEKELETLNQTSKNLCTDILNLYDNLNKKYSQIFGDKEEVKQKLYKISVFDSTYAQLLVKIQKDQNLVNEYKAQINTNNEIIKFKPEIENSIDQRNENIAEILKTIEEIIFPEIPEVIKSKFNKTNPQQCVDKINEILENLKKSKNILEGEMNKIQENRVKARIYLRENENIIHEFFEKKKEIKDMEWELKKINKSIEIIENVNSEIWNRQMPFIQSYIREFLPKITMGRYRTMEIKQPESKKRKRYEFKVLEENTQEFINKELLSGGTEDQILLVIRVAFAVSLLPQSKGTYPGFLFLDESFASSDNERRLEILNWLTKDLQSTFSQIIIISHQQEIIDRIPFHYTFDNGKIIEKVVPKTI